MTDFGAMKMPELREQARKYGITFPRGTTREEMALALNDLETAEFTGADDGRTVDLAEGLAARDQAEAEGHDPSETVSVENPRPVATADVTASFGVSPSAAPAGEPSLEPLDLEDLIDDRQRVRAALNVFPVTLDGTKEVRLIQAHVPGEEGVLAAAWWVSGQGGVMLAGGPLRVTSQSYDPDTGGHAFTTEDGSDHEFVRDRNCGCGNRLRYWSPWSPPVRITQAKRLAPLPTVAT